MLAALPLYACAPLQAPQSPPQACANRTTLQTQERCYAVARPHVENDYPVSYRADSEEGRATSIDRHTLAYRPSVGIFLKLQN